MLINFLRRRINCLINSSFIIIFIEIYLASGQYFYESPEWDRRLRKSNVTWCSLPEIGHFGNVIDVTRQVIAGDRVIAGTVVRISCFNGYIVQDGTIGSVCQADGTWSDYLGVCADRRHAWPNRHDIVNYFSAGTRVQTRPPIIIAPQKTTTEPAPPLPFVMPVYGRQRGLTTRRKATSTGKRTPRTTTTTTTQAPTTEPVTEESFAPSQNSDDFNCGISGVQGGAVAYKIFGGKEAPINAYPWMVRLQFWLLPNTAHYCGATLISKKWLLTSASCLMLRPISKSRVLLSSYNRAQVGANPGELVLQYIRVVPHPLYDRTRPYVYNYALLELNTTVQYSDNIRPICLPDDLEICEHDQINYPEDATTIDDCNQVITAGWGLSNSGWDWGYPNELRHVAMNYVSRRRCLPVAGDLLPNELCAGGVEGRDACIGDSGGPLMCLVNDRYVLVGVTSSGTSAICGADGKPGIYSRVCSVIQWIRQTINS